MSSVLVDTDAWVRAAGATGATVATRAENTALGAIFREHLC